MTSEAAAIERLRPEFEKWARADCWPVIWGEGEEGYIDHEGHACDMVQSAWEAWQAAYSLGISQNAKAMRTLESLTVGGSEFVDEPERCAAYVREKIQTLQDIAKNAVKARHAEFERGISQERERCAKIAGQFGSFEMFGARIAAAIRNPDPTEAK